MNKKFTNDLIGMQVVSTGGQLVGKLDDFVFETDTGALENLLVTPAGDLKFTELKTDNGGRYIISIRKLKSVQDVIVVDIPKI